MGSTTSIAAAVEPLVSGEREQQGGGGVIRYEERYRPCWWWALIPVLPLLPLFYEYRVAVTNSFVEFGYSSNLTRKRVPLPSVENAEVIETIHPLAHFGGWGIRKNLAYNWAYVTKRGPGVRLTINDRRRTLVYAFNCDDPKAVCDLLLSAPKATEEEEKSSLSETTTTDPVVQ